MSWADKLIIQKLERENKELQQALKAKNAAFDQYIADLELFLPKVSHSYSAKTLKHYMRLQNDTGWTTISSIDDFIVRSAGSTEALQEFEKQVKQTFISSLVRKTIKEYPPCKEHETTSGTINLWE